VIASEIVAALHDFLLERAGTSLEANEDFTRSPEIDSFDVVELVAFAEKRFGFSFSASEMESAQFRTLAGLAGIIAGHLER
jgi:acyl carrier protein